VPQLHANGLQIEYETLGDPADPPVLLVMGLGGQLIWWPDGFCAGLAERGLRVIRYDNRDVGLSSKIDGGPPPDLWKAISGEEEPAYTLVDMAADGAGVLDALGIAAAHVVGVSMGGMIAQQMAVHFPERVRTLCSIMSTPTGIMNEDPPSPEANAVLLRPPAADRAEAIEASVAGSRVIGSPGFPFDEARARARAEESYDRCYYPVGVTRQLIAIIRAGDWSPDLAKVSAPTLVLHGEDDPLVRPSWGAATARAIPGADLQMVPGMGHDLPEGAWATVIDAIVDNMGRAAE
jgi:pimeloyl-ACP methyl ester carboxylesterase